MGAQERIRDALFDLQDVDYLDFTAKLIPNVEKEIIIGVRLPEIKALAKQLKHTDDAAAFLKILPHRYHEENMLHIMLINLERDFDTALEQVETALPFVDNWAVCDTFAVAAFKKTPKALFPSIEKWLCSDHDYTVRYAIKCLMNYFLNELFEDRYLGMVEAVVSEEYYVNMMRAWYFATALAKQYDSAIKVIESGRLDRFTHNKTIQKAVESYRVSEEHKAYLKTLKRSESTKRFH